MELNNFKPFNIPAIVIVIIGWCIGVISWWIALPLVFLCLDLQFNFRK
jgi:hypothetical protein